MAEKNDCLRMTKTLKDNTGLSDQTTVTVSPGLAKTRVADIICQRYFLVQLNLVTDVLVKRAETLGWDEQITLIRM